MTSFLTKACSLSCLLFCATVLIAQEPKSNDKTSEKEVSAENSDAPEGAKATEENEDNIAGPLAGHSYHGEAFNEGPRQQAYLIPGMANVDFPVTTESELAQKFFNQGISALHGFWYLEAERAFRQVHKLDPKCAMAYWGMAMANKSLGGTSPMTDGGTTPPRGSANVRIIDAWRTSSAAASRTRRRRSAGAWWARSSTSSATKADAEAASSCAICASHTPVFDVPLARWVVCTTA